MTSAAEATGVRRHVMSFGPRPRSTLTPERTMRSASSPGAMRSAPSRPDLLEEPCDGSRGRAHRAPPVGRVVCRGSGVMRRSGAWGLMLAVPLHDARLLGVDSARPHCCEPVNGEYSSGAPGAVRPAVTRPRTAGRSSAPSVATCGRAIGRALTSSSLQLAQRELDPQVRKDEVLLVHEGGDPRIHLDEAVADELDADEHVQTEGAADVASCCDELRQVDRAERHRDTRPDGLAGLDLVEHDLAVATKASTTNSGPVDVLHEQKPRERPAAAVLPAASSSVSVAAPPRCSSRSP